MADAAFPNPGSQNPDMALLKTSSSGRGLSACGQYARSRRYRPKADTRRPSPLAPAPTRARGICVSAPRLQNVPLIATRRSIRACPAARLCTPSEGTSRHSNTVPS